MCVCVCVCVCVCAVLQAMHVKVHRVVIVCYHGNLAYVPTGSFVLSTKPSVDSGWCCFPGGFGQMLVYVNS